MAEERKPTAPPPTYADVPYGPHARNKIDFWQAESDAPTPVVMSIHGGGFAMGEKGLGPHLLEMMLEAGISMAAIGYRFSQDAIAPASFQDGARALQFLRSKAEEWNIDRRRFASTGPSAGAGISMLMAFKEDMAEPGSDDPVARESTRLSCVVANAAQSSYDPRFIRDLFPDYPVWKEPALVQLFDYDVDELDNLPEEKYRLFESVSPINFLTKDAPPVMLNYGMAVDAEITSQGIGIHHARFGVALKEKMDALGLHCELYAGDDPETGRASNEMIADFMKRYLLGP